MKFSKEEKYLMGKDKKLKKLINENGPINFTPNNKNHFDLLIGIVISQFISNKAANVIKSKINLQFNSNHLNPSHFENLSVKKIKMLGLSSNKAKCIKELTKLFLSDKYKDSDKFDHEVFRNDFQNVFGIGPWSLQMYEIFLARKLDIFSFNDAGLRSSMNLLNMVKKDSNLEDYEKYSERWSPYRTIASLHLWKYVD